MQIYSKASDNAVNGLLKYNIKTWLFKQGLCGFAAGDMVVAKRFMDAVREDPQGMFQCCLLSHAVC